MKGFKTIAVLIPILLLLLFTSVCTVSAESQVTFGWSHVGISICPDLSGFNLYQSEDPNVIIVDPGYLVGKTSDPNSREYVLTGVRDGEHWWYLTAYDNSMNESGPSNVVSTSLDTTAPAPPGFHIIKVEKTSTEHSETTTVTTTTSVP